MFKVYRDQQRDDFWSLLAFFLTEPQTQQKIVAPDDDFLLDFDFDDEYPLSDANELTEEDDDLEQEVEESYDEGYGNGYDEGYDDGVDTNDFDDDPNF